MTESKRARPQIARKAVSSHSSPHSQEVQFSLHVYTGGIKPHSFYFINNKIGW